MSGGKSSRPKERHSVPSEAAGQRLDRYLAGRAGGTPSRSGFARLIASGDVRVNGLAVKASYEIRAGDTIEIEYAPAPPPEHLVPEPMSLSIVFEDDHLLVIDKPAGLVVHPGSGIRTGTLVHGLLHHSAALSPGGAADRPGIVHRLDKETSGLLVVAKTEAAHVLLSRDLAARRIRRVYGALVWGKTPQEGRVEAAIGRDPRDRKRMRVRADGRPAATRYRAVERFSFATLLEATLETGRTHQIRVHMAHIGHPVFGDPTYGGRLGAVARFVAPARAARARDLLALLTRQALHARALSFRHPTTGAGLSFESPLPADIEGVLVALRGML